MFVCILHNNKKMEGELKVKDNKLRTTKEACKQFFSFSSSSAIRHNLYRSYIHYNNGPTLSQRNAQLRNTPLQRGKRATWQLCWIPKRNFLTLAVWGSRISSFFQSPTGGEFSSQIELDSTLYKTKGEDDDDYKFVKTAWNFSFKRGAHWWVRFSRCTEKEWTADDQQSVGIKQKQMNDTSRCESMRHLYLLIVGDLFLKKQFDSLVVVADALLMEVGHFSEQSVRYHIGPLLCTRYDTRFCLAFGHRTLQFTAFLQSSLLWEKEKKINHPSSTTFPSLRYLVDSHDIGKRSQEPSVIMQDVTHRLQVESWLILAQHGDLVIRVGCMRQSARKRCRIAKAILFHSGSKSPAGNKSISLMEETKRHVVCHQPERMPDSLVIPFIGALLSLDLLGKICLHQADGGIERLDEPAKGIRLRFPAQKNEDEILNGS